MRSKQKTTRRPTMADVHGMGRKYLIDPKVSRWRRHWDLVMVAALLFTAVVTPVEVSFLDEGEYITTLWWVNRVVDFCFLADMLISFNSAYQETPMRGGYWVYSRPLIVRHYLR